jgi:hypothetical protein
MERKGKKEDYGEKDGEVGGNNGERRKKGKVRLRKGPGK